MSWREETIGDARLICADCREVLPTLGKVDAVVTDPPYGVPVMTNSKWVALGSQRLKNGRDWGAIIGNDESFDPSSWLAFEECLLWGANHFAHRLEENGRWLVWDKRCGVVPERSQADCEMAWVKGYGAARMIRFLWDGVCQDEKDGPRKHPAEKPLGVMKWCLKFIKGETILDPFMGSGTTGVACAKLGRRFIGIEIDPGYFGTACRRIEQAYAQPDLFIERPPEPKQLVLL